MAPKVLKTEPWAVGTSTERRTSASADRTEPISAAAIKRDISVFFMVFLVPWRQTLHREKLKEKRFFRGICRGAKRNRPAGG